LSLLAITLHMRFKSCSGYVCTKYKNRNDS